MASRRSRTSGFSLIEALVGLAAGLMLLGIAYAALTAGSRIGARAESKLAATSDSELVFRQLARDLSAALCPPLLSGGTLTVQTPSGEVRWTFAASRGAGVERRASAATRWFTGALIAAGVTSTEVSGHRGIAVTLLARGPQDAAPVLFNETFLLRGPTADPEWNALDERPVSET